MTVATHAVTICGHAKGISELDGGVLLSVCPGLRPTHARRRDGHRERDGRDGDGGHGECPPHQHYTCDDVTEPVCAKYECESDIVYGNQLDNLWTLTA
ncbi:MAG: hypothetical protein HC888_14125 [Candidatus Competibacteraceae bacterium]|nr:hypothetical protein [Candidatus Competibacteraceae bacterium]